MHQKNLEYLGLSEKEARVYFALLKVDKAQAVTLARKTGIKQPTVYVILESLVQKHLVKEIMIGKRISFEAESPDRLRNLVEKEKSEIDAKLTRVENVIAELKTVDKEDGERPVVRYFEGKDAMKLSVEEHVRREQFSEGMDYGIYSYDLLPKIFAAKDLVEIDRKRVANNIRFRAIYSGSTKVLESESKLQELIKVDQERFPILCDIGIFNDEVRFHTVITNGQSPSGIVIKNKEISTTLKSIIDYVFSLKNTLSKS